MPPEKHGRKSFLGGFLQRSRTSDSHSSAASATTTTTAATAAAAAATTAATTTTTTTTTTTAAAATLAPAPPKHSRTRTAPEPPTLLRLPSSTTTTTTSSHSRRATLTSSSTLSLKDAKDTSDTSNTSSASNASNANDTRHAKDTKDTKHTPGPGEVRSPPGARRPPASHSTGYDNSRGPPVTLITRGNSDIVRRSSQKPPDMPSALSPTGPLTTSSAPLARRRPKDPRDDAEPRPSRALKAPAPAHTQHPAPRPAPLRRSSTSSTRPDRQLLAARPSSPSSSSSSSSASSDCDRHTATATTTTKPTSRTRKEPAEDLFLHIAEDSAPKQRLVDAAARERLRSRIARVNNRSSFPSSVHSDASTPAANVTRIPHVDPKAVSQPRRTSLLPTASRHSPLTASTTKLESPRTRVPELTSKASFSSRKDAQLSPAEFLAQFGKRPPSQPDTHYTPSSRQPSYRPSNLNYSSSRDDPKTPQGESFPETGSRADGTESHGSTGPAVSVWDELDDLKTRIRRIELGGKIPSTSGAIVSQATADRPRTANTSATTVSSSPNQTRKSTHSSSSSTVDTQTPNRSHPLLREALAKVRQHTSPDVYRRLEATAAEALALAELTGSGGPQGTLSSASSVVGGAPVSDRQVRRKADNICRGLTELCISLCDSKSTLASPAVRTSIIIPSRRPSVQVNGESPPVRQSIEPESNSIVGVSPSRALTRIEARRTSMLINESLRESSQEADRSDSRSFSQQRAGTSFHRARNSVDEDEDEDDPTIRAPSRAMTDFRNIRSAEKTTNRHPSRQYTSQEPMPGLQPSPTIQPTSSLRRPTVTGINNENSLLFRDGSRRYNVDREGSPAYETPMASNLQSRIQFSTRPNLNRNSIGTINDLGRSLSLGGRRLRGASTGE